MYEEEVEMFKDSNFNITKRGKKHLGAALGHEDYKMEFLIELVEEWVKQIEDLSTGASYEPQATYTAFTISIRHRNIYFMKTLPGISELLKSLEHPIRHKLIPALTKERCCSDDERALLSFPVRLGGLGIINSRKISD